MKIFKLIKKDEVTRQGGIILVTTLIAGLFNYIYQICMGRILGPEEYSIFGALFSISLIINVVTQTFAVSATNFVSTFIGQGKEIGFFIKGSIKRMVTFGIIISIVFIILSKDIMNILKLPNIFPIMILILILFLNMINPVMNGIIRGIKRFSALGFVNISYAFGKMTFGILLVMLGFGANGALFGIVLGIIIAMLISYIFIRPYIRPNNPHDPDFKFSSFYMYSVPVLFVMIGSSIPTNIDVILAKHFFSPTDAGIYTSISVLGRLVFFFPMAIGTVIFPMIVERHTIRKDTRIILKKGLLYTTYLSGPIVLLYILFPEIIIKLFGSEYINALPLIIPYGIGMFLFSILTILANYYLAIKDMKYVTLFIMFTILQIIFFLMFHSSILEMAYVLLGSNVIFMILSLLYISLYFDNKNKVITVS